MKREQIIKMIKTAEDIQIGGECCREMSHGLVLMPKDSKTIYDYYFVECDDNKLKEYDTDNVAIEEQKWPGKRWLKNLKKLKTKLP